VTVMEEKFTDRVKDKFLFEKKVEGSGKSN
jgi:hypothetical protein